MENASTSGKVTRDGRVRRFYERTCDIIRKGYDETPAVERGLLSISGAASAAMYASRLVTLINEHRHGQPAIRSLGRRIYHSPGNGKHVRIHHYVAGIAVLMLTGGAATLNRDDGREIIYGLPLGIGIGLTLDEVGLLLELDNPYWSVQGYALAQAALTGTGSLILAGDWLRRGMRASQENS